MPKGYMFDFCGNTGNASEETMMEALKTMDFQDALAKQGSLPQAIEAWVVQENYKISDRGLGGQQWHLGIPFDDLTEAFSFFVRAEKKFRMAIDKKWVSLKLMDGWLASDEKRKDDEKFRENNPEKCKVGSTDQPRMLMDRDEVWDMVTQRFSALLEKEEHKVRNEKDPSQRAIRIIEFIGYAVSKMLPPWSPLSPEYKKPEES